MAASRSKTADHLAWRKQNKKQIDSNDVRHGTEAFYVNYMCRCAACKLAAKESRQNRRSLALIKAAAAALCLNRQTEVAWKREK